MTRKISSKRLFAVPFWLGVSSLVSLILFAALATGLSGAIGEEFFIRYDSEISFFVGALFTIYFFSAMVLSFGFFVWVFKTQNEATEKVKKILIGIFMICVVGYWWYLKRTMSR